MEQHPIPQNITGFQFKLVGDMTLKQFAYLAGGVLSGYLVLQLGLPALISWILAFCLGTAGFAFAFVPLEERPLDRWLASFLRNVYASSQFIWKKTAKPPEILTAPLPISLPPTEPEILKKEEVATKIEEYLMTLSNRQTLSGWLGELDLKEANFLKQIQAVFPGAQAQTQTTAPTSVSQPLVHPAVHQPLSAPATPAAVPTTNHVKEEIEFTKRTAELTGKISALQQELSTQTITRERFLEIQGQLSQLLAEKDRLTGELVTLKRALANQTEETTVKPTGLAQVTEEPRVKIVMPQVAPKIGIPKTSSLPNTPSGIIKNRRGLILAGVLVEIRNQEGTPVRALKTNKLGQFAVATPLPNGTYTLRLNDPQKTYYFDIIELTVKGEIVTPLEIFAKTQQDKTTEELRKKLFSPDKF